MALNVQRTSWSNRFLIGGLLVLLALMPFQTFLTVFLVSHTGHLYLVSAWKEALITVLSLVGLAYFFKHRQALSKPDLVLLSLTATYLLLQAVYLLSSKDFSLALVSGAINARFIMAFWVGWLAISIRPQLTNKNIRVILGAALLAALIGVLLATVLPLRFLEHFGYDNPGVNHLGIPPSYQQVADSTLVRAQSTMRGPNVFGAYLILPIALLLFYAPPDRNLRRVKYGSLLLLALALLLSFSRSAWIGAVVVILLWAAWSWKGWLRSHLPLAIAGGALTLAMGLGIARTSYFKQVILHDPVTANDSPNSNEGHWIALKAGANDVLHHPLGGGLGTAGPASSLEGKPAKISENYFLQVGQELGWFGLILLLAIHVVLFKRLWDVQDAPWVRGVLAAFIGLAVTNLLLHTWTDEAVAIIFWACAGIVYANAIIKQKTIKHEKTKKKASQRS